ncbi:MAG: hypothetical protein C4547_07455 [Phycisphaerales bacterium]|nr:MAG: hypothetical protein C4547_07455 [Phycisphaerales bacterium]
MSARRLLALEERRGMAGIPLTPMIDVVFLLIIFLLFGRFDVSERQVIANLQPPGDRPATSASRDVWLTLRQESGELLYRLNDGAWSADAAAMTDELASLLQHHFGAAVIVDPKEGVTVQQVVDAFGACAQAGAAGVSLRTD